MPYHIRSCHVSVHSLTCLLILGYYTTIHLYCLGNVPGQRGPQSGPAPAPHSGKGVGQMVGQYDPAQEVTAARARSIRKLAFLVDELLDRIRGTECKEQDLLCIISMLLPFLSPIVIYFHYPSFIMFKIHLLYLLILLILLSFHFYNTNTTPFYMAI